MLASFIKSSQRLPGLPVRWVRKSLIMCATKKAVARLGASLKLGSHERKEHTHKALRQVTALAKDTIEQSCKVLHALRQDCSRPVAKSHQKFAQQIALARQILEQTQQKLDGVQSIPERIVSFHDPAVRVIRKGKLHKPNEFGRTMQLVQDASGIILDYQIDEGNPSDKTQLLPLVKRFKRRFARAPSELATDRGYYSRDNVSTLRTLGVRRIAIPKIGRLSSQEKDHQRTKWFKQLQRFRCAIEAGISMLKRQFSLGRVLSSGYTGTAIWTGFAIFSYNLWQLT